MAIWVAALATSLAGCGGDGGKDSPGERLHLLVRWEQIRRPGSTPTVTSGGNGTPVPGGVFAAEIPQSVQTIRVTFESDSGFRCCLAVPRAVVDRRPLILDGLPTGGANVTLAGFPSDFAPADGIANRCATAPAGIGEPCDARPAAPSFHSNPTEVDIAPDILNEAGTVLAFGIPFLLNLSPAAGVETASPITVRFTVADSGGVIEKYIVVYVDGAPTSPADMTPCDDLDAASPACSDGRAFGARGFAVVSQAREAPVGSRTVRIRAASLEGRILDFSYDVVVPTPSTQTPVPPSTTTPPTDSPTPAPTDIPTAIETATSVASSTPSSSPTRTATPSPSRTPTVIPSATPTLSSTPSFSMTPTHTPVDTPTDTPTLAPTPTRTPQPTPTPANVTLTIGSAAGTAASVVAVPVGLHPAGTLVLGTQNLITLGRIDAGIRFAARMNELEELIPDCQPGDGLLVAFGFRPQGCSPATDCDAVMTTTLSSSSVIADVATLYTCNLTISSQAAAGTTVPILCSGARSVDPQEAISPADCPAGSVEVSP